MFKPWAPELCPQHESCCQSNPWLFCNVFDFDHLCTWALGSSPVNCRKYIYIVQVLTQYPLSLDSVLAGISKLQPVASFCVLPFGGPSIARTDTENLSFCPGVTRSTFLLSPGQLWQPVTYLTLRPMSLQISSFCCCVSFLSASVINL